MDKNMKRELQEMGIEFDDDDIVDVSESAADLDPTVVDIVYEQSESSVKKGIFFVLKLIPLVIMVVLVIVATSLMSQFKLIPENVAGSSFSAMGFSFIAKDYQVSVGNIVPGSKVVWKNEGWSNKGFIVADYDVSTVKSINSMVCFLDQDGSKDALRIPTSWILYIIE